MSEVVVINYGMGNLRSVANMLRRVGAEVRLVDHADGLHGAQKVVIPGVGHFEKGMSEIRSRGFEEALSARRKKGAWILGICLGMQLMTQFSDEASCSGLGWINAKSKSFRNRFAETGSNLKVPHMGWSIATRQSGAPVFQSLSERSRFYFVHSYFVELNDQADLLFEAEYGNKFCAGFVKDRMIGVQFHPEKSLRHGMCLMKEFVDLSE
jgi:imidazole glycerol-phosphate synthase subunit HisH